VIASSTALEPSASARARAALLLEQRLGPSKVATDPDVCASYARDESEAVGRVPDAVVTCRTGDDVVATLAVARETGVPVTPRAAGTGRTGGAAPVIGGIVLAFGGMSGIKDIDRREQIAVVEPGVVLADLHRAVEAEGLFYPPDPNSLESCAIGGNVAENAGGPRAVAYGVTRDYVLGLEAFLVGGAQIFCGRRTRKGVTGYDVTGLLVGSEGTLAVFGDITLRLVPKPDSVGTLLLTFATARAAAEAVTAVIEQGLPMRCCELLDEATLDALRAAGHPVRSDAGALLIVEVDGDEALCERRVEHVGGGFDEAGALEVLVARAGRQRDELWSARREMSRAVRRMAKNKLAEDVVVPRTVLSELLDHVRRDQEEHGVRSMAYGHAGDGNLHVNYLWDADDERPRVEAAIERLFRRVVELGGTLSGEHGIGVLKAPYLSLEQPAPLVTLQQDLKRTFDPAGLLNPGKIFTGASHRAC
jgi:glycolate oxidase